MCCAGGILGRKPTFTHERLGNFGLGERLERHPLGARNDGGQQLFGMIGTEQKDGLPRWFFEQLQDLVSTGNVHQLGQPNDDHFVASACRNDAHFTQQFVAFVGIDAGLLLLNAHALPPFVEVKIGPVGEHGAPLGDPQVAHHLRSARSVFRTDHRKGEMQIGVRIAFHHAAGGTSTTRAGCFAAAFGLFAKEEARKIEGDRHLSGTGGTGQQEGVRQLSAAPHVAEPTDDRRLSNDRHSKGNWDCDVCKSSVFFEMRGPSGLSSTPTREKCNSKRRTRK